VSACPAVVADNKASGLFLDGPRRQEAFAHCPMSDAFLRCAGPRWCVNMFHGGNGAIK
jgi:hypothetical protein